MAGMEGLGRVFNVLPVGDNAYVNLRYASGVTFVCVGANNETFTVTEAKDASGTGAQVLTAVDHVFTNAGSNGANAWAEAATPNESSPASVVTTTTAAPVAAFFVNPSALSDGYTHLKVASSSTGTVVAITHDLNTQRKPSNLPALGV